MESSPPSSRPLPLVPEHELLARIGAGSFGEVWLARSRLGTLRAVKVVYRDRFESARAWEREMKGLRQFEPLSRSHDGLVDILQVGQSEAEGWAYCVMELADEAEENPKTESRDPKEARNKKTETNTPEPSLRASAIGFPSEFGHRNSDLYTPRSLASDLRQRVRLPAADCVSLGLALADALAHLHRNGLLHRDVKPSNIVFVGGVPKLADIGLVAAVKEAGSFVGTRGFMPPEGHQDGRGDVFSLGKVLYECAWGRDRLEYPEVPTNAADWTDHPQLIELNEVILKATEPHRERRYVSMVEMRDDLDLLQQGQSVRRLRRLEKYWRRTTHIAAVAVILALLAVVGFFFQQHQSRRFQKLSDENRDRLVQLQVANGVRHMDEGDFAASALWFAEALRQVAGDPEREWVHRRRLQSVLERSPRLIAAGAHRGRIRSVQFSPDGRLFATAGMDGAVRIWNATNGSAIEITLQHEKGVHDLQFSPDGRWLATAAEDNAARVWNVSSGEMRFATARHSQAINSVRFSPDGRWLATASEDHTAQIWNAATGQPEGDAIRHDGPVNDAEFSPQGNLLATASDDDTARLWDVRTGSPVGLKMNHDHDIRSVRFSPTGKRVVTASKDGTARVWDVANGEPITPPLQHSIPLWTAQFSPDGRTVLAAGGDGDGGGTARIWDATTGDPRTPPMRHGNTIRSAIFNPDGRWIATASHDRSISLWDSSTGARVGGSLRTTHLMKWVSFSPDGKHLLAAGEDEAWRLWDVTGVLEHAEPRKEDFSFGIAKFSPDGRTILGVTANQTAVLCDTKDRSVRFILGEHSASVTWAAFSLDGRRALTMCQDGVVRVWSTATGKPVCRPMQHGPPASREARAEFSPDGRLVATVRHGGDRVVKVWDLETDGTCMLELEHAFQANSAAFSPDGLTLLTGGGTKIGTDMPAGETRLWSIRTGRVMREPMPHPGPVVNVRWSGDGRLFLTACRDTPLESRSGWLWDAASGKMLSLPARQDQVLVAAFSPNHRFAATSTENGTIRLWNVTTGTPVSMSYGHRRACYILEFSPDGRQLASASHGHEVRICDPLTGEPLGPALDHGALVRAVVFNSTDDTILVSGGGRATLWHSRIPSGPPEQLQRLAQLVSGCRLDTTGGLEPLTTDELSALLQRLRNQ